MPDLAELSQHGESPVLAWWRGAVIGAGALLLALGTLWFISLTARTLALLFVAIALAEGLAPLVERLARRVPRSVAIAAVYLVLLGGLTTVGWYLVPRLAQQAQALAVETPALLARAQRLVDRWDPTGEGRILAALQGSLGRFTDVLVAAPVAVTTSLVQLVLVVFMSAYWLIARPALGRFTRSLLPTRHHRQLGTTLDALGDTTGGYVRGAVLDALIVGALTYGGLMVIGVDYPIVLAMLATVGELVPVVGPILSAVPAVLVGFLDSPTQGVTVLVFYLVLQQVESNIILPHTMDQQADVPPLLALVALFAGAGIGGLLGAMIAIPLAGAARVLVLRLVAPAVRGWTGAAETPQREQSRRDRGERC